MRAVHDPALPAGRSQEAPLGMHSAAAQQLLCSPSLPVFAHLADFFLSNLQEAFMWGGWVLLLACAFAPRAGSRQVLYRPMNSASFVAHQEMPVHCLHARCSPLPNDVVRVLQKRNPG